MKKKSPAWNLPKELTTVSQTSKLIAASVFVALPFIGFIVGMSYQQWINGMQNWVDVYEMNIHKQDNVNTGGNTVACTMDAKVCPDGSAVGRVPPTCEFAACTE